MKARILKAVLFCMCISFLLNICGCRTATGGDKKEEGLKFSQFSQVEKIEYVSGYIKDQYNIEVEISEVIKRQVSSMQSEEYYYAIAKCDDTSRIYCWIDDQGKITDSKFINDMSDQIHQLFEKKTAEYLNSYKLMCSCTLNTPTEKKWDETKIEKMIAEEDITTVIRIFVSNNEKEKATQWADNNFNSTFDFAKGICYIYFVDDIEKVDMYNYDLTDFDMNLELKGK